MALAETGPGIAAIIETEMADQKEEEKNHPEDFQEENPEVQVLIEDQDSIEKVWINFRIDL